MTTPREAPRTDIQSLRALAVLIVLLYYAKLDLLATVYSEVNAFFQITDSHIKHVFDKSTSAIVKSILIKNDTQRY